MVCMMFQVERDTYNKAMLAHLVVLVGKQEPPNPVVVCDPQNMACSLVLICQKASVGLSGIVIGQEGRTESGWLLQPETPCCLARSS